MIKRPPANWRNFVDESFQRLAALKPLPFSEMVPSKLPQAGGVYLITARLGGRELPYYVGRSKNLRRRLYNNHLMGPLANARLKKYLINSGECSGLAEAKQFLREYCLVRWIEEADIRKRGAIEGYVTGLLFPKHGIYEEH
jgi:hypothetical protein